MKRLIALSLLLLAAGNVSADIDFDDTRYDWNSVSCRTSPDGSSVSCGGQSVSCLTSPSGYKKSCGGWSKYLE